MLNIYNNLLYFFIKIINIFQKLLNSVLIKLSLKYFGKNSINYYKNAYSNDDLKAQTIKERISNGLLNQNLTKHLNFNDGETFLEIGCGYGLNLIEIKKKFPNSGIYGCDIHSASLKSIDYFNKNNFKNIDLNIFDALKVYEAKSIDHVYIMHTLTHIMDQNKSKTNLLRRNVIENMMRISRKKVFIIENKIYYGSRYNLDGIYFINSNDSKKKNRIEYFNNIKEILPDKTTIRIFPTEYNSHIFEIINENI